MSFIEMHGGGREKIDKTSSELPMGAGLFDSINMSEAISSTI